MRSTFVSVMVVAATLGAWPSASAGGYDQFFYNRHYFRPGETVRLTHDVHADSLSTVREAGPYRAYLVRESRRWWRGRPNERGLPLGTVRAGPADERGYVRASITFKVPKEADPGLYQLEVCNTSCRKWLGALGPTAIGIAATPVEERLLRRLDRVEVRLDDLEFQAGRSGLRSDVRHLTGPLRDRVGALDNDARRRLDRLGGRVEQLRTDLDRAQEEQPIALVVASVLLAALAGLVGGLVVSRARRAGSTVSSEERPKVAA